MSRSQKVEIWAKWTDCTLVCDSIRSAAGTLGIHETTLARRLKDGYAVKVGGNNLHVRKYAG